MMKVLIKPKMCERYLVSVTGIDARPRGIEQGLLRFIIASIASSALCVLAETTNAPAVPKSAPQAAEAAPPPTAASRGMDESAFRILAERNIFNANRSGGQVRVSSSRRPARVESFTLVGTMAYAKGAYAFFAGSSSEFSKAIKAGGVIAGHKIVDVLANAVKLEADGKILDLPIGSAMRREDEGPWHLGEGGTGSGGAGYASNRESGSANGSSRSSHRESSSVSAASHPGSATDHSDTAKQDKQDRKELKQELKLDSKVESEVLKRLMENREKESQ